MKWVDEFRDPAALREVSKRLRATLTRPWSVMEICGGQTHAFARFSLEEVLPKELSLVHGPGCPVCVTPASLIDGARALALEERVTVCSFGDMLRVPGARGDLLDARARGGDVRLVLSPLEALKLAQREPSRTVVFFAVGFETTAPTTAMAVLLARKLSLQNFLLLPAHVRVPPVLDRLFSLPDTRVHGLLAAGHVCTVAGTSEYPALAERHRVPMVVTGFEPLDLLLGLQRVVELLESGEHSVENRYERCVQSEGNPRARAAVDEVFEPADGAWRGLGTIPSGVLRVREAFAPWDATKRFRLPVLDEDVDLARGCRAAEVLQGKLLPNDCSALGTRCTPEHPLGAPMVSTEGACAAYYRFRRVVNA